MCYCGSNLEFKDCCEKYINGTETPVTAVDTMKSRYSAFANGDVDYILDTHHPETRDEVEREDVEIWSNESDWLSLTILETVDGGENDAEGIVEFIAEYRAEGYIRKHRERSVFKKMDNRWFYHSQLELKPLETPKKVGRNEPCPCGSGKKYKKCCGK